MTFKQTTLLRLTTLAGAVILITSCRPGKKEGEKAPEAGTKTEEIKKQTPYLTPVYFQAARRLPIEATIATTGSIIPSRSQALRAEEPGELHFSRQWREGDFVEQGTIIAEVKSTTLERELSLNRSDIELQEEVIDLGERTLNARKRDFRTLQDLYARGIAAQKEVDAARLELDRAINQQRQNEINLEKARVRLEETELRKEKLTLRVPYDGMIVSRTTLEGTGKFTQGFGSELITDYEGRQITAGQVICGVVDVSSVMMRCDVTSKDIGRMQLEQDVNVTIYSTPNIERRGRLARISNSVNPETRAFEVDVLIENADRELKPGMFGKADVVVERRLDRIVLPKSAVTRRNNQDVVFVAEKVADADYDVARLVNVELGLEGKDEIEIAFGLRAGDRVVVRGHEVLQDQSAIRPIDLEAPILATDDSQTTGTL